jgi:hypothetical protein
MQTTVLSVDIGSYGTASDSHVFQCSNLGQRLQKSKLRIPKDQQLSNDSRPVKLFVFIGDEAAAFSKHLLRPYGIKDLNFVKRIFNY